jgi:hypothetical protein
MWKKIYNIPYVESIIGSLKLIIYTIIVVSIGILLKIFEEK